VTAPLLNQNNGTRHNDLLISWDQRVYQLYTGEVEDYTDGSLRIYNDVASRVLTPPTSLRQPVYAQGGLVFHFGYAPELQDPTNNITITLEGGTDIELLLPSSVEL